MMALALRIILILLPFILYFMWMRYIRQKAEAKEAEDAAAAARAAREITIAVAGLVLVTFICVLGLRLQENQADPSKTYIPPHSENGQVIPGRFK